MLLLQRFPQFLLSFVFIFLFITQIALKPGIASVLIEFSFNLIEFSFFYDWFPFYMVSISFYSPLLRLVQVQADALRTADRDSGTLIPLSYQTGI